VVSRIPLPGRCGYIHVEPDGRTAFASIGTENLLARIDLEAGTVETLRAGELPDKFEIVGERAFVANVTEPTVSVVDLTDPTAEPRSIEIGAAVVHGDHGHRGMRLFGDRVFVPNEADHTVSVIDVETEAVIATLDGIMGPSGIAIAGAGVGTTYPR
jgi:YVTN family beta-propeller protein